MAAISRMRIDAKTKAYVARKTAEGHSELEIIRCIKHYLAREIYHSCTNPRRSREPLDS